MIKQLGDICTFVGGGTPSKKNPDFYNGSIPWATVRDMNVRVIKTTEHSITPDAVQQSATNIIPKGEVVISTHVGLGKVCFLGQDTAINQDLKAVIPNGELSRRYLYYWFISKADELIANGKGATVKGVTLDFVKNLKIQVLPEREQEVVSDTLDKVNHIIELADSQVARLDQLVKSRFVEMFGDLPNSRTLADVCLIITDGTHQSPKFVEKGIPFLFVSNIVTNRLTYDAGKFIDEATYSELIKRTPIEPGDILLSTVGSYGHPAIVQSDKRFLFQRHIAYLKPSKAVVDSVFLHGVILSSNVQEQIERKVKGIAQKTLNLSEIKTIAVPLPPFALQREFAAFVAKVDKLAFAARQRRDVAKQLYRAKIQEFFG